MTAPDLTAIVESVARDHYERWAERVLAEAPDASVPSWDDRDGMSKHSIRETVLPIVHATLTALMPLADGWESMAVQEDALAASRIERSMTLIKAREIDVPPEARKLTEYARQALGSRDAFRTCADTLRGVLS